MTIYEVIEELKRMSFDQPNVNAAGEGDIYEFLNGKPDQKYSVFFATQGQHKQDEMFDHYSLTLFYIDRLTDDQSNRLQIQSTGKEVLNNIIMNFSETYDAETGEISYQPFTQRFADFCAGVFANLEIVLSRNVICADMPYIDPEPEIKIINQTKIVDVDNNGEYYITYDEGYTGLGAITFKVNVQPALQEKSVEITSNGIEDVRADGGFDGLGTVHISTNVQPALEKKADTISENGQVIYRSGENFYGMEEVKVDVNVQPDLQNKAASYTENGKYTITPDAGFDGLEGAEIDVNVPIPTFTTEEKTVSIVSNGQTVIEKSADKDGMTKVIANVDVPQAKLEENKAITVNQNGKVIVSPSATYDALKQAEINVEVPIPAPKLQEKEAVANGDVLPDPDYDGLSKVIVSVPAPPKPNYDILDITYNENGQYTTVPPEGIDAYNKVKVKVDVPRQMLEENKTHKITKNGITEIMPDEGFDALKKATVDVDVKPNLVEQTYSIEENGKYAFLPGDPDIDGYSRLDVSVNVPVPPKPSYGFFDPTYNENGQYDMTPPEGIDAFDRVRVTVNVPVPEIEEKRIVDITSNGTTEITPGIGFSGISGATVNVDVPVPSIEETKTQKITAEGITEILPDVGFDALKKVSVDVDLPTEVQNRRITKNGSYTYHRSEGVVGITDITVDVKVKPNLAEQGMSIVENGRYTFTPTDPNVDGYSRLDVSVNVPQTGQPKLQEKTATVNGDVLPDPEFDGLSKVIVNVPQTAGGLDLSGTGWDTEPYFPVNVARLDTLEADLDETRSVYSEDWATRTTVKPYKYQSKPFYFPKVEAPLLETISYMCSSGKEYVIPSLNFPSVMNATQAFYCCHELKYVGNISLPKATNVLNLFRGSENLESVGNLYLPSAVEYNSIFLGCSSLKNVGDITFEEMDTGVGLFEDCNSLKNIGHIQIPKIKDMNDMFKNCYELETLPFFDTKNVITMNSAFSGCRKVKAIPPYDTSSLEDNKDMFYDMWALEYVPEFDFTNAKYNINLYSNRNIKYLGGFKNMIHPIDISTLTLIDMESIRNVIEKVGNVNNDAGIGLNTIFKVQKPLDPELISIATGKGWTISYFN